jgi:hypothetical protein
MKTSDEIIWKYFKNLNSCKQEDEKEIDKFLHTYDSLKLNQKVFNTLNRFITSNKTETVMKELPTKKSSDPDGFTAESYQTNKEQTAMFLKLFHEVQNQGILLYLFYKPELT